MICKITKKYILNTLELRFYDQMKSLNDFYIMNSCFTVTMCSTLMYHYYKLQLQIQFDNYLCSKLLCRTTYAL